jgi:hypothetical protein
VISWRVAIVVAVGVVALAAAPGVSTCLLVACALAAFIGPARALQALMISTLIVYANPNIVKLGSADGILLRVVFLAAVLRILPTMRGSDLRVIWPVWLFSGVCALGSWIASPAVDISMMKIITFALAATVVPIAYKHLTPPQLEKLQKWVITVGITVIGLSALTLLKPGFGAGRNGGLQGLLNQPQALGIFIAPFAAWAIAGVLLMKRRASKLELWVALGVVVLIVLTRARTAGFATFFGVGLAMASRMLARRNRQQAGLARPLLVGGFVLAAVAVLAVTTTQFASIAKEYAFKGTQDENRDLGEAFYASRGGGVEAQWQNFKTKPMTGNGFGVQADGKFRSGVVKFMGIPISAPVEKGFLPTAILEDAGVPGGLALLFMVVWLGRYAWRCADLRWRAMFLACLGMNIGECVLLSPGGIGMFDWLLLSLTLFAYRTAKAPARAAAPSEEIPPAPELALPHSPIALVP